MANLTLTIDEDLLRKARIRALERGTTVNAVVRSFLERFAMPEVDADPMQEVLSVAKSTRASSGRKGRTWTRDSLYEDRRRKR